NRDRVSRVRPGSARRAYPTRRRGFANWGCGPAVPRLPWLRPRPRRVVMSETPQDRPHTWMEVLDRMESALAEAMARTPELEAVPQPEPGAPPESLDRLEERLASMQERLEATERDARAAEEALAAEADAAAAWVRSMAEARRALAEVIARVV